MRGSPGFDAGRGRRSAFATFGRRVAFVAGVAGLGFGALFLLPGPGERAALPRAGGAGDPASPAGARGAAGADRPAPPGSRDVTPPGLTRGPAASGTPTRLPALPPPAAAAPADEPVRLRLLPRPVALDTGTFGFDRGTVRLGGVVPLAPAETCGSGALAWPCGMQGRTALRAWLRARSIRCPAAEGFGTRDETIAAACSLGGADIGAWVVGNGWARAAPDGPYREAERRARAERRGLWREAE